MIRFALMSGLTAAGLVALCAALLAALHLLRVRPRRLTVVTTCFWAQAAERTRARTLLHRFRHPWTYVLLLLAATMLALALGRPEWRGTRPSRATVLVLDGGLSMAAPDGDGTRWSAAVRRALDEAARLGAADRLAVLVAHPWPRLVHTFDDARPLLRRTLAGIGPCEAPGAIEPAIRLAGDLLRGAESAAIVVVTDRAGSAAGATGSEDTPPAVRFVYVGSPADNAAIVAALFQPDPQAPLRGRLVARVGFWGAAARAVTLSIRASGDRGGALFSETRSLGPGATGEFELADVAADGSELLLELTPGDAIAADSRATVRLPRRSPIRAAVAGDVPAPLKLAVASDPATVLVGPEEPADVQVSLEPASGRMLPSILVGGSGPELAGGTPVVAQTSLRSISFRAAGVGMGTSLSDTEATGEIWLAAGGRPVASFDARAAPARLRVAPALLADDATLPHEPGFAALIVNAVRRLAGWSGEALSLTAERATSDPLFATREAPGRTAVILAADRDTSDVSRAAPVAAAAPPVAARGWELADVLLTAGLLLVLVQAGLHARGRIA